MNRTGSENCQNKEMKNFVSTTERHKIYDQDRKKERNENKIKARINMKEKIPFIDNPSLIRLTELGIERLSLTKKAKDTSSHVIEEVKEEDHDY